MVLYGLGVKGLFKEKALFLVKQLIFLMIRNFFSTFTHFFVFLGILKVLFSLLIYF